MRIGGSDSAKVFDATDDPGYGDQEGRHFHGYYDCYCYLPLYIFCGRHLLAAKLRSSSIDAADGSVAEVARIVAQIRIRWPRTTIVIRADSGFCCDDLMTWCETNDVQSRLAGNSRLVTKLAPEMRKAKHRSKRTSQPARVFADFDYRTRRSWTTKRRVIGQAEWTNGGANPRFIVTNIHAVLGAARFLYEDVYCQRGEMENRLKECQGDLFADRTPAPTTGRTPIIANAAAPLSKPQRPQQRIMVAPTHAAHQAAAIMLGRNSPRDPPLHRDSHSQAKSG
jgi:hypothetical protein